MLTDIGEYVVGAYLKLKMNCDVVDYNVRPVGGGLKGLEEIDVIGFNLKQGQVFLCEVTTHILGLQYGKTQDDTMGRIKKKYQRMLTYADVNFKQFPERQFMFWSPNVRRGLCVELQQINGLELVVNGTYTNRVKELQELAKIHKHDSRNPFFRMLQIMEHLRD